MDWLQCLQNPAACVASNTAQNVASSMWQSFARWMADGLSDLTINVFKAFSESTSPRFDQTWWSNNLNLMVAIALPFLVGMFVLQCLSAAIRREPGRLGQAVIGALVGTAGVPFAVAVIAGLGRIVDEISGGLLGSTATTMEALKNMVDLTAQLALPTLGGSLVVAVSLGLLAVISLYGVLLIREVAIIAFVVFAPIAMASWTWSATRHWLRRWIEIVAALLFSKIAMALIFTLGLSAIGGAKPGDDQSIGTFLAGVLLFAMAAFAPIATYSFVHWAGDHAGATVHLFQQGTAGATALKQRAEQAQQWTAQHFGGGSGDSGSESVVGSDSDSPADNTPSDAGGLASSAGTEVVAVSSNAATQPTGSDSGGGSTATAVATSQASISGAQPTEVSDTAGSNDSLGGDHG